MSRCLKKTVVIFLATAGAAIAAALSLYLAGDLKEAVWLTDKALGGLSETPRSSRSSKKSKVSTRRGNSQRVGCGYEGMKSSVPLGHKQLLYACAPRK